nr:MAG TPA: hypothetical protein [Caudoviricetes sp.]
MRLKTKLLMPSMWNMESMAKNTPTTSLSEKPSIEV